MNFESFLYNLDALGLSDIILPFLFVFVITYGVLSNLILFKKAKAVDAIIALIFGAYATLYAPFAGFLREFIATSVIVMILIIMCIIVIGSYLMFSHGKKPNSHLKSGVQKNAKTVCWILLIAVILFFRDALRNNNITYLDPVLDLIPGIITIFVIYIFIKWLVSSPSDNYKKFIKDIDKEGREQFYKMKYGLADMSTYGTTPTDLPDMQRKVTVRKLNNGELSDKLTPESVTKVLDYFGVENEARGDFKRKE